MHGSFQRARRVAFTLIELLVVIAVIAILASLILSGLVRAKAQAARTHCLSNQRQIGFAYHMYTSDNNEFYPAQLNWTGRPPAATTDSTTSSSRRRTGR